MNEPRSVLKRPWLLPLNPLYRAGATVKNVLYDRGMLRVRRLDRPVVSVGSLSAGGAGKTPVVLMLAKLLRDVAISADVLTRGYGRTSQTVEQVDPRGEPNRFGDEPLEMAQSLPVYVGAERYAAGVLAERTSEAALHLLDDGFQHRRLARNLELVLLTRDDVEDSLLPAGNLREPLASLRRADVVILREDEAEALSAIVAAHCRAEVWTIRRELKIAEPLARPFVFCGIARPEGFVAMLRAAGCLPVGTMLFPDHHRYTEADIETVLRQAKASAANGFYTTRKDAVKILPGWVQRLATAGPVHAPQLQVSLLEPEIAVERLRRLLQHA